MSIRRPPSTPHDARTGWSGLRRLLPALVCGLAQAPGGAFGQAQEAPEAPPAPASYIGVPASRIPFDRTPLEFRPGVPITSRVTAPPALRRQGPQARVGAIYEWQSNPRLSSEDAQAASAFIVAPGLRYRLDEPGFSIEADGSVEAIEGDDSVRSAVIDAAVAALALKLQLDPRLSVAYDGLVRRSHQADGAAPSSGPAERYATDATLHGLTSDWRVAPRWDVSARVESSRARSRDPRYVRTSTTTASTTAAWLATPTTRLGLALAALQARFADEQTLARAHTASLQWQEQWSPTLAGTLALGVAHASGGAQRGVFRSSVTHTQETSLWEIAFDAGTEAPNGLGGLRDVRRIRLLGSTSLGSGPGRLQLSLEGARYAALDGAPTVVTWRPSLGYTWPVSRNCWLQIRWDGLRDEVRSSSFRREGQILQVGLVFNL